MAAMLYKTNIFAIVGCEKNKDYKQNQVLIWDDDGAKILYKINLQENVINLKLRSDKVFIVCLNKIYILNAKNEYVISGIYDTGLNPNGLLIAINYNEESCIIVYPSNKSEKNKDINKDILTIRYLDKNDVKYFSPHEHKVTYIALSYNGQLLATASEDGIKIRIFDTETLESLHEFHRGKDRAEIKYIAIDIENKFVAVSSSKNTIHIWILSQSKKSGKYEFNENENNNTENQISNTSSFFSVLPNILGGKLFNNEWSFAKVKLNESESDAIFQFISKNSLIIITSSGKCLKAKIDMKNGGICENIEEFYI